METLKETPPHKIGEWGWYASENSERYCVGPETSREDVIDEAKAALLGEEEHEPGKWRLSFMVARCQKKYVDIASYFDIECFLEQVGDSLADEISIDFDDKNPLEVIETGAREELQILIRNVIREWQTRHGYEMACNTFMNVECEEHVVTDHPDAEEGESG